MIKGFRQIAVLTMLSRVLGMVRDMCFACFLGRGGLSDAWVIAFKIPNLSRRIFGEGALSSSFIPVYVEQLDRDPSGARQLAGTVVSVLFVLLSAVTVLAAGGMLLYAWWFKPQPGAELTLVLASVMLPYMVLICSVAALAGILQSHRHFGAPAFAPVLLNLVIISCWLLTGWVFKWPAERQIGFVAGGVLLAGVLQLMLQIATLKRIGVTIRWAWQTQSEPFRRVILLMVPMILGLTVTQLNTLADDLIALVLSSSATKGDSFMLGGHTILYPVSGGAVSSLFYAQRLYQFPLGVLGISLATAIFPVMSSDASRGDMRALTRTVGRGMRGALFIALPATAGLFLVADPLVSAIFEQGEFTQADIPFVSLPLMFYALGLSGYFMQQVTTRAFYALQDSKVPCRSAIIAVGVNLVLNLTLIWWLGTGGLALATAISSYCQVAMLSWALRRRLGGSVALGLLGTGLKSLLATSIMMGGGCVVLYLMSDWPLLRSVNVVRVAVVVAVAAGSYWVMAKVLKIESLALLHKSKSS